MADKKISALTGASTPLAGTEVLPIVQSGATVKVSAANITAGRAVSVASLSAVGSGAGGTQTLATFNAAADAFSNSVELALEPLISGQSRTGIGAQREGVGTGAAVYLKAGGNEVLRGTVAGNISVATGNVVMATAGKGIDFSANGGDVLTQYDEGTWTPVATGIVVNSGTPVWSGTYTRVGRTVVLQWALSGGANINTTLASYLSIPFTALGNSWGTYGNVATNTHIGGIVTYGALLYFGTVAAGISSASGTITIQI
jgi:hypothetical protein